MLRIIRWENRKKKRKEKLKNQEKTVRLIKKINLKLYSGIYDNAKIFSHLRLFCLKIYTEKKTAIKYISL